MTSTCKSSYTVTRQCNRRRSKTPYPTLVTWGISTQIRVWRKCYFTLCTDLRQYTLARETFGDPSLLPTPRNPMFSFVYVPSQQVRTFLFDTRQDPFYPELFEWWYTGQPKGLLHTITLEWNQNDDSPTYKSPSSSTQLEVINLGSENPSKHRRGLTPTFRLGIDGSY